MRLRYKLAIFVAFQPFLMMFDRFLYTFLYVNGFDFIQIAIIDLTYGTVAVLSLIFIGNYADIKGKKKIIPLLMGYYSIFPLIYVRFRNFLSTVTVRFFEALKHPYFPLYYTVTQDLSPKEKQGRYFGIVTALTGVTGLLVYLIAGFVIEIFNFEVLAILTSIIVISFCIFFVISFPETTPKTKDIHRRVSLKTLKNRFILAYSIYQFIIVYVFITNWIYLPIKSFNVTSSFIGMGLILFAGQIVFAVGQIPCGMLADRVGMLKVYVVGILLSSVTSFLLGFFKEGMLMAIVNFMAGLAYSLTTPAEQALVNENIPETKKAEFNNTIHVMKELGAVVGVLLATIMAISFGIDYIFYLQSVVFLIAPIAFFITFRIAKEN